MKATHTLNGELVTLISNAKGWNTVKFVDGGEVKKVRTAALVKYTGDDEVTGGNLIHADLTKYVSIPEIRTASGRATLDCGDGVAKMLRGMALDAVYELAAKHLEVSVNELKSRYEHLNLGMRRMNIANRLRKVL